MPTGKVWLQPPNLITVDLDLRTQLVLQLAPIFTVQKVPVDERL